MITQRPSLHAAGKGDGSSLPLPLFFVSRIHAVIKRPDAGIRTPGNRSSLCDKRINYFIATHIFVLISPFRFTRRGVFTGCTFSPPIFLRFLFFFFLFFNQYRGYVDANIVSARSPLQRPRRGTPPFGHSAQLFGR